MVTAEGADRIYDLIHLPQWYAIHRFVQLLECVQECLVEFGVPLEQFFCQRLFRLLTLQGDSLGVGIRLRNLIQGLLHKFLSVHFYHSFDAIFCGQMENIQFAKWKTF